MQMITYTRELFSFLERLGYRDSARIAVEAHIFTPDGKVILEKRGKQVRDEIGKLEGVGGSIGIHKNLHQALRERINCELGPQIKVEIDYLLEVRKVQFVDSQQRSQDWIIVSYLCRLINGRPIICEPDKIESLHELTIDEIYAMDEVKLSRSTSLARLTYNAKYGNHLYYETAN